METLSTALSGLEQILWSKEIEVTLKKIEAMVGLVFRKGFVHLSFYEWDGRSEMLQILNVCHRQSCKTG